MPTKILFLGMDAGDKFLLQHWAAEGILPNIGSLLKKSLVGDTTSLRGFFVGSTWPSWYTGVTPGRHGFHHLLQLNPGTYTFSRCNLKKFIRQEPFWNFLSQAGKRIAILDIPLSFISEGLNGIQMVEWASHDSSMGFSTWPPQLKWEVHARFGWHSFRDDCDSIRRTPRDFRRFTRRLIKGVRKKTELTKYYLDKKKWDFFAQVFTEGHCAGHQGWHLHDEHHPNYDRNLAAIIGDPLREVYQAIDTALGEILAQVDESTLVLFLASHRMASYFGAQFLLPDILISLKVARKLSPQSGSQGDDDKRRLSDYLKWGWRQTPILVKDLVKPFLRPLVNLVDKSFTDPSPKIFKIDPGESKVFILFNGSPVSGLRLNLKGREPQGLLQPGAESESFCEELARDLMGIVDQDSGRPIVKKVIGTDELYQGEYLGFLPDLLVEWNEKVVPGCEGSGNPQGKKTRIFSPKIGVLEGLNSYCRTGDHRSEGIFLASGPGITPERLARTVSIMDFAPTICQLLGVELPNVEGKPIAEIL
jgi:predicted AlkP superfamily phosphohydrolase/phosphomutase